MWRRKSKRKDMVPAPDPEAADPPPAPEGSHKRIASAPSGDAASVGLHGAAASGAGGGRHMSEGDAAAVIDATPAPVPAPRAVHHTPPRSAAAVSNGPPPPAPAPAPAAAAPAAGAAAAAAAATPAATADRLTGGPGPRALAAAQARHRAGLQRPSTAAGGPRAADGRLAGRALRQRPSSARPGERPAKGGAPGGGASGNAVGKGSEQGQGGGASDIRRRAPTRIGRYQVGDEIGKGGFGTVYRGLNNETGDYVAIKTVSLRSVDNMGLESLQTEIQLLRKLNHPNIVKYVDTMRSESHLHIVLEYVENGSLAQTIKKFGPFNESLCAIYVSQVLQGLVYLHDQGVIHRDIKGANILTTKEGLVKLADFGVAISDTEKSNSVVGTPYWMAPEIIEMAGPSSACDIWSVGCTVIELITGKPPYFDLRPMTALFRIVQDDYPPLPEHISPALRGFLVECFKKEPSFRKTAPQLLQHPWILKQGSRPKIKSPAAALPPAGSAEDGEVVEVSERERETFKESVQNTIRLYREKMSSVDANSGDALAVSAAAAAAGASADAAAAGKRAASAASDDSSSFGGGDDEEDWDADLDIDSSAARPLMQLPGGSEVAAEAAAALTGPGSAGSTPHARQGGSGASRAGAGSGAASGRAAAQNGSRGTGSGSAASGPTIVRVGAAGGGAAPAVPNDVMDGWDDSDDDDAGGGMGSGGGSATRRRSSSRGGGGTRAGATLARQSTAQLMKGSHNTQNLSMFAESDNADDDWGDMDLGFGDDTTGNQRALVDALRQASAGVATGVSRPTAARESVDELFDEADIADEEDLDLRGRHERDLKRLVGRLGVDEDEASLVETCEALVALLKADPTQRRHLVTHHGVLPIVDLLDVPAFSATGIQTVLKVVNLIVKDDRRLQEALSLVGVLPPVLRFAAASYEDRVRVEAAAFIRAVCNSSDITLQMFVACGGVPVLVRLLEPTHGVEPGRSRVTVDGREVDPVALLRSVAVSCVARVFTLQTVTRNEFCRLFVKAGLLPQLTLALNAMLRQVWRADTSADAAAAAAAAAPGSGSGAGSGSGTSSRSRSGSGGGAAALAATSRKPEPPFADVTVIADLLVLFSSSDTHVKSAMATHDVASVMMRVLRPPKPALLDDAKYAGIVVRVLKAVKNLSMEPTTLDVFQRAGAIPTLVPILDRKAGPDVKDMHNFVMHALFYLCRVNRVRQEAAAVAGVIPTLQRVIASSSALKQFALPILCDLARTSKRTRNLLWDHGGLDTYLDLLSRTSYWQVHAFSAVADWLVNDMRRVQEALLRPAALTCLVTMFQSARAAGFQSILAPFVLMLERCAPLATALSMSGLFVTELVARLTRDKAAIVLKSLLKLLRCVFERHPRPCELMLEFNLYPPVQHLASADRFMLVQEMARGLLVDFEAQLEASTEV